MNNVNPLRYITKKQLNNLENILEKDKRFNRKRFDFIYHVVYLLDMSYEYASGGDEWYFVERVCKNDKVKAHKLCLKYNKLYDKVNDMVNNCMFEQAYKILTSDPVMLQIQRQNMNPETIDSYYLNTIKIASINRRIETVYLYLKELGYDC